MVDIFAFEKNKIKCKWGIVFCQAHMAELYLYLFYNTSLPVFLSVLLTIFTGIFT